MVKIVKNHNIPPLYFSLLVMVAFMCSDHEAIPCHAHYILSIFPFFFLLQHQYLTEALHWRAQTDPDHVLFVLLNAKVLD